METINQQLNIVPTPRNSNMRSRMARGANDYQVQLGTEDPSLDFYNDISSISNYHNANGWNSAEGEFNNFLGYGLLFALAYPPCVNDICRKCKNDCKTVKGLKWRKGGKECHKTCVIDGRAAQMDRIRSLDSIGGVKSGEIIPKAPTVQPDENGLSTPAMIGIGIGALALVIGVVVLIKRK